MQRRRARYCVLHGRMKTAVRLLALRITGQRLMQQTERMRGTYEYQSRRVSGRPERPASGFASSVWYTPTRFRSNW